MADILIIGGGIGGLCGGMLLARDGHRVRVLERDPHPPPASPDERGTAGSAVASPSSGCSTPSCPGSGSCSTPSCPTSAPHSWPTARTHFNRVLSLPEAVTGGVRPGDERFASLTGRRPMVEGTLARLAAAEPGLEIRRGVGVRGLLTAPGPPAAIPRVIGVTTEGGDEMYADLVVDAGGRRSAVSQWLVAAGGRAPLEERDDVGFVYYARHFRSADGSVPVAMGPPVQPYESITMVALPADNGTWGVGFVASAKDAALRAARRPDVWERIMRSYPLVAHWIEGQPISDIDVMAKIEDRHRQYWVDGAPVATGLVAVGDAWACTNPSVGRGASIALRHVVALRDALRDVSPADGVEFAERFEKETAATVEPLFRDTQSYDRHRLAEIEAQIAGRPYETDDVAWNLGQALRHGAPRDPDLLRAYISITTLLERGVDVFRQPGIAEKAVALGTPAPAPGPSRQELVAIAAA